MADGARLSAFISISISTHFVFQAEIKIIEAVPGRGSATPRAPARLWVSTELPAAKPRTTCSCGSFVHRCGWCFAHLEDEGFLFFLKYCFTLCPFSGHVSSWDVWASPSPVSTHATPLASWEGLWDARCPPWAPKNGRERAALRALGGCPQLPFRGRLWPTHTPLSISLGRSCCCKAPVWETQHGSPAPPKLGSPLEGGWGGVGGLCIPRIPKTWLQRANPRPRPALYGVSPRALGGSPPPLLPPL